MSDGAPGPDGRSLNDLKGMSSEEVAAHFNLWLLAGYPPASLRRAETVLIAKEAGVPSPEEHRPITISDVILRCFHKILASRFEATLPWNTRQKAFMKGDGVADSIWLLQTIIRQHQRTLQPLNIAFIDIRKAFDSISHESLLLAAGRMGVPPPLLGYLGELYGDAWTCLRIGPDRSEPIRVSRGVRQGDPLSVHLFNASIDWALDCLDPQLGVMVGEVRVNAGAFTDDIALIARTSGGLQFLLNDLAAEFRPSGLEISAGLDGKSASLRIDVDGKRKMWIVNPHPHLRVFGQPIPAIDVIGTQQYLGVPLSPMRTRADIVGKLNEGLGNITSAPLKPQQRLFILKTNLIPALFHQLVLTANSKKYLKWLDRSVRAAVRSWLKLPHDTPKAYFHAKIFDGGLGIVTLEHQIPLMKIRRIDRLWASNDPVIREMLSMEGAELLLARQREPSRYGGVSITSGENLQVALTSDLHASVDGRGLRESDLVPHQHQWVADATSLLSGANYIGAVKVRGNLLPSAVRAARGRPAISVHCGACQRPGSLRHILQVCPRTHSSRISRHDRIVTLVQSAAGKAGWSCIREPAIPTTAGLRRPDLIFHHNERSTYLLDVTIVADNAVPHEVHERKVQYYDVPDIRTWLARNISSNEVQFSSVSLNWRGLMARASAETLCSRLGLGRPLLSLLSAVTCERSLWIWQRFHRSNYVIRG